MTKALSLEERIQILEDIEAIKNLKHDYVYHGDVIGPRHEPEKLCQLFTEDGRLELQDIGEFRGRQEILKGLTDGAVPWSNILHYVIAPKIKVDGDTATGTWYLLSSCVPKKAPDEPEWCGGYYYENYVRTPDGWRIKHMKLHVPFQTKGWAKAFQE